MPQTVELMQMLEARDRRAQRQRELLAQFDKPIICFTMNIAGPIKNNAPIRQGFRLGCRRLTDALAVRHQKPMYTEQIDEVTGNEAIFILDMPALAVKKITAEIEDRDTLGRLFDMDVLIPGGRKIDRSEIGLSERRCLICGGPARECARSRTHSVAQLQEKTAQILNAAIDEADADDAASLACRALLYEVCTTPKPGLVDRQNSGSHTDMDIFSFMASAAALTPYFRRCCTIGRRMAQALPAETFAALRAPGLEAEGDMLRATGNVNTHKGVIFSMGILCGALGRLSRPQWKNPDTILAECAAMTKGLTVSDFAGVTAENAVTVGQRLYVQYGITGVRGQTEAGFPAVSTGLRILEEGLAQGLSRDRAGCAAMLHMLCEAVDTNLIARSDVPTQRETVRTVNSVLESQPYPDNETLSRLDRAFIEKNLSPGGSADLLAICYFLHFLKEEP